MSSACEHGVAPAAAVGGQQAGDGGVGVVGDVHGAAGQRPHEPACRRCRSRGRGRGRPRRGRAATAAWSPTGSAPGARSWVALAVMHSPTVRRSCQPSAGPIGSPVARSQTTVLARWLVMPTAVDRLVDGGGRPRRRRRARAAPARRRRTRRARGTASTAGTADVAMATMTRRSSTIAARTLVVPTSRTRIAVTPAPSSRAAHRRSPGGRPDFAAAGRGGHR